MSFLMVETHVISAWDLQLLVHIVYLYPCVVGCCPTIRGFQDGFVQHLSIHLLSAFWWDTL